MTAERRHAERREFEHAISGIDFPASQSAIYQKSKDKGGLDTEVPFILERVPERTYDTMDELWAAIERVYAEQGGLVGAGPAAKPEPGERPDPAAETRRD